MTNEAENNVKKIPTSIGREKVIIVGSAEPTLSMTPWNDTSFDIWALAWRNVPRADAYFDMHSIGPHRRRIQENYHERLAGFLCPVYVQDPLSDVPNSIKYPYDDIVNFLVDGDDYRIGEYFCSSISYMLAMAMWRGYKEVHIYGVNLIDDEEYVHQRPNLEYLIGLARGRGMRVFIPEGSALLRSPRIYGYDESHQKQVVTEDFLKQRINTYQDEHHQSLAKAYLADGAAQEARQILQILRASHRGLSPEHAVIKDPSKVKELVKKEATKNDGDRKKA